MQIPNIEDYNITRLSHRQQEHLSRELPGARLYVVPLSKNAATLNNIEKYDIETMGFRKWIRSGFCCTSRNRLYFVPKMSIDNDPPPSYQSAIASESARGRGRERQTTPTNRTPSPALSIVQQLDACHAPISSSSSSHPQQTAQKHAKTFENINNDLTELARLCVNRASIIKMFFTRMGPQCGPPPVPTLAADLNSLAASLNALRPSLQLAAKGGCGSSRDEILEDGERVVAGLSRWMDKMKPMFEELRVVMFGSDDGFTLHIEGGKYVEWARKAREMEKLSLIMKNRVWALRQVVKESLLPQMNPSQC